MRNMQFKSGVEFTKFTIECKNRQSPVMHHEKHPEAERDVYGLMYFVGDHDMVTFITKDKAEIDTVLNVLKDKQIEICLGEAVFSNAF